MASNFIQTVLGAVHVDGLSATQMHEHIILDYYPSRWGYESILNDKQIAVEELKQYKQAGGSAIVELTLITSGRDPVGLREISQLSGVHIVMGTGISLSSHVSTVEVTSTDHLADFMVRELTVGVEGTGICAGIIGELGAGALRLPGGNGYLNPSEERLLRAGGRAHLATGALISIDTFHGELAFEKIMVLKEERVPPERIVISHLGDRRDIDFYRSLGRQGVCLSFDHVGMINYAPDEWRIEMIKDLLNHGYEKQIVLSMDVNRRSYWKCLGGIGYDYLLNKFVPLMLKNGVSEEQVQTMLIDNPKRLLPFEN